MARRERQLKGTKKAGDDELTEDKGLRLKKELRLDELRELLSRPSGATLAELAEHFGASRQTIDRYLKAVAQTGAEVEEEWDGPYKRLFLRGAMLRSDTVRLKQGEMVMLLVARHAMGFLRGTGFLEQFNEVCKKLESKLVERKHVEQVRNLSRKIYDLNEEAYSLAEGKDDDANALLSALLFGNRLEARHVRHDGGRTTFKVDPYTLVLYRKGVYLVGFSEPAGAIRTFALDGFEEIERLPNERFEYPTDYSPEAHFRHVFGITTGVATRRKKGDAPDAPPPATAEPTLVRIRFDPKVTRYVKRRCWHPSQEFIDTPEGLEMRLRVHVDGGRDVELRNLVLRFGDTAEVLEPEILRQNVVRELENALAKYRAPAK